MARSTRTQVGIIGAGPAGLMLSHLLHLAGVESIVLESRSRDYVEQRVRAGVLEQGTVDLLLDTGVGERMRREGLVHRGIELRFAGRSHRIDFEELTDGKTVTVYGQQEVVKDLIAARLAAGGQIVFEAPVTSIAGVDGTPTLAFAGLAPGRLTCDYVVGCDGFHGVSRDAIPNITLYDRTFPFAWLGILAHSPPVSPELIYTHHERGFALVSMRSPTVTRLYLQCAPDEDTAEWPDERFWEELRARLAGGGAVPDVKPGDVLQKSVTTMRSFIAEPMQYGKLFIAGDAAHIVPPTGAKGMNLALADVRVLAAALNEFYTSGRTERLAAYSETCLRRVWLTQRFSVWMTSLLHRFDSAAPYDRHMQAAEQQYVVSSRAAKRTLAENYVGLPATP